MVGQDKVCCAPSQVTRVVRSGDTVKNLLDTYNMHVAHYMKSHAAVIVLANSHVEYGPREMASFEGGISGGGAVVTIKNVLRKESRMKDHSTTVVIDEEGTSHLTFELFFKDVIFTDGGPSAEFVENITGVPANLIGNTFNGHSIKPPIGDGTMS